MVAWSCGDGKLLPMAAEAETDQEREFWRAESEDRTGMPDGRKDQASACAPHAAVSARWIEAQGQSHADGGREGVKGLWQQLCVEHRYAGSYRSRLRYVARRLPATKVRPVRRVETVPGGQAQVDWVSPELWVEALGGAATLHALVMTRSHSRMWAVIWSLHQDLLAWLHCHNQALRFLRGVAATVRIDNLKTGVASGGGPWASLQPGSAS